MLLVFVGFVMADDASRGSTGFSVAHHVPGDSANDAALDAALRVGGPRDKACHQKDRSCSDYCLHRCPHYLRFQKLTSVKAVQVPPWGNTNKIVSRDRCHHGCTFVGDVPRRKAKEMLELTLAVRA